MSNNITGINGDLVSIGTLTSGGFGFSIPSNQRGYRWRKQQVEDLLNDIDEFYHIDKIHESLALSPKAENGDPYYCLQPLIVAKLPNGTFSVIDGQQRLTTIFIILSYLGHKTYELDYKSRPDSKSFIDAIKQKKAIDKLTCVDFKYMSDAMETINNWFSQKIKETETALYPEFFKNILLRAVKFIWYPVGDAKSNDETHEIFERINAGKIPLTDAELIKAWLLNGKNFIGQEQELLELKKYKIAAAWDEIERYFGNNDFWYFIDEGKIVPQTRIDLLFRFYVAINKDDLLHKKKQYDEYELFNRFRDLYENSIAKKHKKNNETMSLAEYVWNEVVAVFEKMREWYDNDELFHKIGFLIATGKKKSESIFITLNTPVNGKRKDKEASLDAVNAMITEVMKAFSLNSLDDIVGENLTYKHNGDNGNIKWILLLHNIATVVQGLKTIKAKKEAEAQKEGNEDCDIELRSDYRFSFEKFKTDKWDIEHIHARADAADNPTDRKIWLDGLINSNIKSLLREKDASNINDQDMIDFIDKISNSADALEDCTKDGQMFQDIYKLFSDKFSNSESTSGRNGIENLALLSYEINRSYKNAVFPIKREKIIMADKNGEFVPPCTRNIFLKYYTANTEPTPLFWSIQDAGEYLKDIKKILGAFLGEGKGEVKNA